jgi:hypothetical protein
MEGPATEPAEPVESSRLKVPNARQRWQGLFFLGLGAALFGWVLWNGGAHDVVEVVRRVGWRWPLLLLPQAVIAASLLLSFRAALPNRGRAVPWGVMIQAERSAAVLTSLLPLGNYGGNIAKVLLLRHWYTTDQIIAAGAWGALATGLSHVLGAIGPVVAAALGRTPEPLMAVAFGMVNVVMAVPSATILLLVRRGLSAWIARLLVRLPLAFLRRRRERIVSWAGRLDRNLADAVGARRRDFLIQLAYKAMGQAGRIGEIWLAIELLGLPGGIVTALLYNAFSRTVTTVLSFIPGQLGVLEISSMVAFDALGFTPEMGLQIALVLRFRYVVNMLMSTTALGASSSVLRRYPPLAKPIASGTPDGPAP